MDVSKAPLTRPDAAKGLSRVSLIFACGTALFSDGYVNGVIGSVNTLLTTIYPDYFTSNGTHYSQTLSSLAFVGMIVGMLSFGWISDKIGRKAGMMSATVIVAVFSALSAASYAGGTVPGIVATLSAYRFLVGIGLGAEYPCGSVAASEQSESPGIVRHAQHRWFALALATDTMIDFGFVVSAFVPLVLLWIFGYAHLNAVWRISLGLGVVPAVAVFIWRLRMVESPRYARDSMKHAKTPYLLIFRRYWGSLLGVCITWFIYDFITYPFSIYASIIVDQIIDDPNSLYQSFGWNVVINLFYMPGTFFGAFIIDYLGPKYTMILGLLLQALFGFFMCGSYNQLSQPSHIAGFAIMYGLFLTFGEVGPGNNLGLVASKTGPTAFRARFYGIAAAVGKVGAFVGTWAFPPMIAAFGKHSATSANTGPFWVGSGLAILNALVTFFLIRPIEHDGMEAEDREFRKYLESHGYDTSKMGLAEEVISADSTTNGTEKELGRVV